MSLKDDIVEDFGDRIWKNPWVPYTGPSGGQGWMNQITGEVRYQENRPEPDEGAHDEEDLVDVPEPEEEIPDTLDPYEPTVEDLAENLEEGMSVTVDGKEGEIASIWEAAGDADVDFGEEGIQPVSLEDIDDHPAELEPPGGWAEGWTDAPQDYLDLEEGQAVEVYLLDQGEYVQGEVQMIQDDPDLGGTYVSVTTDEDYPTLEIIPDDPEMGHDALVTAQEDLGPAGLPDDVREVEFGDLEEGDRIYVTDHEKLVEHYGEEGADAVELEVQEQTSENNYAVEAVESGVEGSLPVDAAREAGLWEETPEFEGLEEIPEVDPEAPEESDWPMLTGHEAVVETLQGEEVEGELEFVREDPQGYSWFSVGDGEDAPTVTTNPEHPLYIGSAVSAVDDPWETLPGDFDSQKQTFGDLKTGDKLMIDGEVHTVEEHKGWNEMRTDEGGWIGVDELENAEAVSTNDPIEVPEDAYSGEWQPAVNVYDDGSVDMVELDVGDYVYWYDEDAGEMKVSQVDYPSDGPEIETEFDGTVHRADVEGVALDAVQNVVDPSGVVEGDTVTVRDGNQTITGGVTEVRGTGTNPYITVVDDDGEEHKVYVENADAGIQDHSEDPFFEPQAIRLDPETGEVVDETPTEEVVEDLKENINFGRRDGQGRLDKGGPELAKAEKQKLKRSLYQQFGVEAVEEFYRYKGSWKGNSASNPEAETLEQAYQEAFDINAPTRDNGGSPPSKDIVKMAEVVGTLSQDYFEEVFGESETLHRGSSGTAWESFVDSFLADPRRGEYPMKLLANNNHTTDKTGTADKWNVFTASREVESGDVLTMTDHLFETSYEGELEIGVRGDEGSVPLDGIYPGGTRDRPVSLDPIEDWDSTQAEKFWQSMSQASDKIVYEDFDTGQLENLKRAVEAFDESDSVAGSAQNEVDRARNVLMDKGVVPETGWENDDISVEDFEGLGEVTGYEMGQGVPVTFYDEYDGETVEGEAMGTYNGEIMVWEEDEFGDVVESEVQPEDIIDVDEYVLEDLQEQAQMPDGEELMENYSPSIEDFESLDDVYVTFGGDNVYEGTVTSVYPEMGEINVSRDDGASETFDVDEVEQGMVVPKDQVDTSGGSDASPSLDDFDEVTDIPTGTKLTGELPWGEVQSGEVVGYNTEPMNDHVIINPDDPNAAEDTYSFTMDEIEHLGEEPDDSGESEGSDDGWQDLGDAGELEPGDEVRIDEDVHGQPVTAEVDAVTNGNVYIDEDTVDADIDPDSFYWPTEIDGYQSDVGDGEDGLAFDYDEEDLTDPIDVETEADSLEEGDRVIAEWPGIDEDAPARVVDVGETIGGDPVVTVEYHDPNAPDETTPQTNVIPDDSVTLHEPPEGSDGGILDEIESEIEDFGSDDALTEDLPDDVQEEFGVDGGEGEEDDTPSSMPAEAVTDAASVGEEITVSGVPQVGEMDVVVTDVSVDPNAPVEVEDVDSGHEYLIWPDGEVEGV